MPTNRASAKLAELSGAGKGMPARVSSFFWWQSCFIAAVSLYDAWLVVIGRHNILFDEQNPLHSLRHFFCSQCFLGGASEGEIKEWLGHADSKMVEHYRHLRSEDAQRKMNRIRFLEQADGRPDMKS